MAGEFSFAASRHVRQKLCIVIPSHWEAIMGGSQYQAKVLVEYLVSRYEVQIFYLTTRRNPTTRPQGYEIVQFSDRCGLRRWGFFFDTIRLYAALRRIKPDAIIQFVGCAHTGIAAYYARRHGCRMVWRVSSDRSVEPGRLPAWWQFHRRIERRFLDYGIRHASIIAAQSDRQRAVLARRYRRADAVVLRNFHPEPRASERGRSGLRIMPGTALVTWVANLKPLKNPAAFVRLAHSLSDRSDLSFLMLGRAMRDDEWTRSLLADIAATPNLHYLGERSQDEVNALLRESTLLINTSDYEGFSNTFVQAWMRGVPVVSLHVDPDELLSRGKLGVVAHTDQGLRQAVIELTSSDTLRYDMSRRCRAYAFDNHGETNIDHLAGMLALRPRSPAPVRALCASES